MANAAKTMCRLGLLMSITAGGLRIPAADDPVPAEIRKGMTTHEVRRVLGPPIRIVREVLYRRHIEQWVYENPHPFRVKISCVRGEDPVVTGVIGARIAVPYGKD
jgi:hypothetical protein